MAAVSARLGLIASSLTVLLFGSLAATTAGATVISGASSGFDATFDASVNGTPVLSAGPGAQAAGVAPPAYSLSDSMGSFVFSDIIPISDGDILIDYSVDLSTATATSNVDGGAGSRTTNASGGLSTVFFNIAFDPTGFIPAFDLLTLNASVLTADASVTGDFGSLVATGNSTIIGGSLFVFGEGTWTINAGPAVNTTLISLPGLSLVLNEQTENCSGPVGGTDTCSIDVNVGHLEVNKMIGTHMVGASVVVGHADASQVAVVPEPTTALLMGMGLALLAGRRRSA